MSDGIFIGLGAPDKDGGVRQLLNLRRANRHGLIAGATGTGKTVTLQGIAESFSALGVPVFLSDVKGDLSGIAMAGSPTAKNADKLVARAAEIGLSDYSYADNPAIFWDLYGEQGHPIRTTISEMGPLLLARLMGLNETQEGVLSIAFKYADEEGLLLLDLGDLQAMLSFCAENADTLSARYGNVTKASVGAIQRQLLQLEAQGGAHFFGEPALDIHDMIKVDEQGRGYVNILAADKLMQSPKLYATFLLWLLSELFETLPEVGDPDKPVLVFFFDEAHLLFDDAPKALTDKIEQVVRLIRSKGVGVYFVTQNPIDIPEDVAGQLGNRVQHALRAFTPRDQRAIKAAAETFRINPDLNVETAITELKVGEALVSLLQEDGSPGIVQRTLIAPPRSRLGPVSPKERAIIQSISPVAGKYDEAIDRESAEEILAARGNAAAAAAAAKKAQDEAERTAAVQAKAEAKQRDQEIKAQARADAAAAREAAKPSALDKAIQSATRAAGSSVGRQVANELGRAVFGGSSRKSSSGGIAGRLVRGILGSLFK
ncbi:helicase HerA-like domain-containing protein [Sphingobium sp.]|uniref:helicase HerA-like domain-containing protein n=1 Tax=Sphingobium sp. TaxID=1912891 RepID=UPI000C51AFCE|nr:helicase HerA-like domain-containing protein [Sphingobium sp.]MBS86927.1 ATP-binding protein [Sphingobium sp.]